jgi:hypothetical protein
MTFKNFYQQIEYIEYLNYEINKQHNLELFNEIEFIVKNSKKYNLNIIFGGAWGNIFHCLKSFRTIKDIDFHVEAKDAKIWFDILDERYEYLYPDTTTPYEFFKNQLDTQHPVPFQNKKNPKLKIDIIFKQSELFKKIGTEHKIFTKSFEEFDIKYIVLFKLFKFTKVYNRQKDLDDIKFYQQFIKYEDLLPSPILE